MVFYLDMPLVDTGTPVDFEAAARRWLKGRPNKLRPDHELDSMVTIYAQLSTATKIPLTFAITQMCHETDSMQYPKWPQPPYRNPAGIGVTGEPDAGQAFDTDAQGIMCQYGLILCYRFPQDDPTITPAQKRLIALCLSYRPNAANVRGVATTPRELADTWAVDKAYPDKLEKMYYAVAAA
jgi:hypothetical protein